MANISVERIFDLLYEHKIQQKELAKALGISAGNITEWKKGRSAPSAGVLPKIADYFDVSTDYLLGKTDEKKPAAETGDDPKAEINERLHTIRIAGRDGSYEERQLTDEQMDLLRQMIRQMPKPQDGDL